MSSLFGWPRAVRHDTPRRQAAAGPAPALQPASHCWASGGASWRDWQWGRGSKVTCRTRPGGWWLVGDLVVLLDLLPFAASSHQVPNLIHPPEHVSQTPSIDGLSSFPRFFAKSFFFFRKPSLDDSGMPLAPAPARVLLRNLAREFKKAEKPTPQSLRVLVVLVVSVLNGANRSRFSVFTFSPSMMMAGCFRFHFWNWRPLGRI